MSKEEWLTLQQVASLLRLTPGSLYWHIHKQTALYHALAPQRTYGTRRWWFARTAVNAYKARHMRQRRSLNE